MLHLARACSRCAARRPRCSAARSTLLDDAPDGVLAYERADGDDRRRVWVNFDGAPAALPEGWIVELATAATDGGLPADAAAILRARRRERRSCPLRRVVQAPRSASAVAASAGKNDSIASSATVMSTAVPKVATVLKKRSSPSSAAEPQRHDDRRRRRRLVGVGAAPGSR